MASRRMNWFGAVILITAIAGCSSKPAGGTVKGTVTLDGQPLAAGQILFVAADQNAQSAEATITVGRLSDSYRMVNYLQRAAQIKPAGRARK